MPQSAIFIDAGFLLSAGGTIVTGTSLRGAVTVNFPKLISGIVECTRKNCGLEPLRVYWYDASQGGFTDEHKRIALLEDVKVRLGRINYDGAQKGVDLRLGLDLVEVARTQAAQVAYLLSGDDDLAEAVIAAQDLGMKVSLIGLEDTHSRLGVASVAEHLALQVDRIVALDQEFIKEVISPRATTTVRSTGGVPSPATFAGLVTASQSGDGKDKNSDDVAGTASAAVLESDVSDGVTVGNECSVPTPTTVWSGKSRVTERGDRAVSYTEDPSEGSEENDPCGDGKGSTVPTPREVSVRPANYPQRSSDLWRHDVLSPSRDLTELFKVADEVGESVASKWLDHASQGELVELREYFPTLPSEIDRVLLRDCASRIGEVDTDSQLVRRQLRQAFWRCIDER